jgi:hypothetical protein
VLASGAVQWLESGTEVPLQAPTFLAGRRPLLFLQVPGWAPPPLLSFYQITSRLLPLAPVASDLPALPLLYRVSLRKGSKIINISSNLFLSNCLSVPLAVQLSPRTLGTRPALLTVPANSSIPVPVLTAGLEGTIRLRPEPREGVTYQYCEEKEWQIGTEGE